MTQDFVEQLVQKRHELVTRREGLRRELKKIERDVAAVDRVIGMIAPEHVRVVQLPTRRPLADGLFPKAELPTIALEVLRDATEPLSTSECTRRILARKGLPEDDPRQVEITNRLSAALNILSKRGRVERSETDGRTARWRIARPSFTDVNHHAN